MAKKQIIVFVCDNCGDEAFPEEVKRIENPLPADWVQLQMTFNKVSQQPIQICTGCRGAVAEALLSRRNPNGA